MAFSPIYRPAWQPLQGDFGSTARGHMGGGGGRRRTPEVGTRDPRHGLGGSYTRKKFFRTRSKYTHSRNNTQRSFDPPRPLKKGVPRCGGGGTGVKHRHL